MACKEVTVSIMDGDGSSHEYFIRQLPATKGLELQLRLAQIFGNGLEDLARGIGKDSDTQLSSLGSMVAKVFNTISPKEGVSLIKQIISSANRDSKRIDDNNFDTFYSNNYIEMYQAVAAVLKVNFGDLIQGGMSKIQEAVPNMTEQLSA